MLKIVLFPIRRRKKNSGFTPSIQSYFIVLIPKQNSTFQSILEENDQSVSQRLIIIITIVKMKRVHRENMIRIRRPRRVGACEIDWLIEAAACEARPQKIRFPRSIWLQIAGEKWKLLTRLP